MTCAHLVSLFILLSRKKQGVREHRLLHWKLKHCLVFLLLLLLLLQSIFRSKTIGASNWSWSRMQKENPSEIDEKENEKRVFIFFPDHLDKSPTGDHCLEPQQQRKEKKKTRAEERRARERSVHWSDVFISLSHIESDYVPDKMKAKKNAGQSKVLCLMFFMIDRSRCFSSISSRSSTLARLSLAVRWHLPLKRAMSASSSSC